MAASKIRTVLEMIKFEHSVFALPFALTAALLAARYAGGSPGWPAPRQILLIVVAMVGARSAAMTMNRIADLHYDRLNPRTQQRPLVTGALSLEFAWVFALVSAAALVFAAWQLNPLAFRMSPAAAWIAISGTLDPRMLILCAAVTLWVGGFDVLYACQDVEFDQRAGLFSVPKKFGIANALMIARGMHIGVIALLGWLAFSFSLPWPAWAGIAVVASLLGYEHSLVKADDLSKLDAAFFTVNGYISMLFLLFWGAAAAVWRV